MSLSFFKSFEFIALLAALMGLSALGIDAVLPAFSDISKVFGLSGSRANDVQLVVLIFMLGFASMQLFFGVLADFLGRKKPLLVGLGIYILASFTIIFINNFDNLLIIRFLQGAGLAAPRVLAQAIVRDVVSGRAMSKIMSFTMLIFLLIPIFAPAIGQMALNLGDWHSIFYLFVILGLLVAVWVVCRLPETLAKEDRRKPDIDKIKRSFITCFTHRPTLIYTLMLGFMFAMMMAYISQAEQIYGSEVYRLGDKFVIAFAITALGMVAASFCNASIVMKYGMHRIVFWALLLMLVDNVILSIISLYFQGKPPLMVFISFLMIHMFCFSMITPNLNSLVLEPHAHIAGTVAAVVGTFMTIIGVLIGGVIAKMYHGNVYPLIIGWLSLTIINNLLNFYVRKIAGTGHPIDESA